MSYNVTVLAATSELYYGDVLQVSEVGLLFQRKATQGRGYEHCLYPWPRVLAYGIVDEDQASWVVVAFSQGEATEFVANTFTPAAHGLIHCTTAEGSVYVQAAAFHATATVKRPIASEDLPAISSSPPLATAAIPSPTAPRIVRKRSPGSEDFGD